MEGKGEELKRPMNESVNVYYSFINCLLRQTFACRYAQKVKNCETDSELSPILGKLNDEERGLLADYVLEAYKGGVFDVLMNLELINECSNMKIRIKNTDIPAGTFSGMPHDYMEHCQNGTWIIDIAERKKQLRQLMDAYEVESDLLSAYLELPIEQVKSLSLPEAPVFDFKVFDKIEFLYACVSDNKSLCKFLQKLLLKPDLSKRKIAKAADVEQKEINKLLSDYPEEVAANVTCKVAVTVWHFMHSLNT